MTPGMLLWAYLVDLIGGDPRWVPHPVRVIGRLIRFCETRIRRGILPVSARVGGAVLWMAVTVPVFAATWLVVNTCFALGETVGIVVTIILASFTLATKSLYDESRLVIEALDAGDIGKARRSLAMIVGRDTNELNEEDILRAVIETVAENLSDGIVAPILYLAVGGVPLAMAYKAVNTLDSMVGYKNERYRDMGFFSARMDDIFNWLPARVTGVLIVAVSFVLGGHGQRAWRIMRRDGHRHASPNSGIPEAAMAGSLGVQLGGANTYFSAVVEKPTIGDEIKKITEDHVATAWSIMFVASFLAIAVSAILLWIM